MKIDGEPGPLEAAAIIAAIIQVAEELEAAGAHPPTRPTQGRWVLSGRPRTVAPPYAARPHPLNEGWSLEAGKEPGET
jgi:hypothetical protein